MILAVDRSPLGIRDGRQGPVCRRCYVLLAVVVEQIAVLEVRVILDLVDGGRDLGRLEDGLQMFLKKVGDSNGLGLAGFPEGFHLSPLGLQLLG